MRRYIKKQIFELHKTVTATFSVILKLLQLKRSSEAYQIVVDLQQALIEMGESIEKEEGIGTGAVKHLEEACEMLYQCTQSRNPIVSTEYLRKAQGAYAKCIDFVRNEIPDDQIKIVFLPYKASMWTAMESIWKAAMQDETCEAKVVVIPYDILGSEGEREKEVYEADKFPDYVPIVDYKEYPLEEEKPDIVIIHNPYDETNTLTRVPEKYYSYNIKPHTNCLVYSPYHTIGGFVKGATDGFIEPQAALVADKVVVQSEFVKQIYLSYGFEAEKILAYGSPKADAIATMGDEWSIPNEWKKKLEGKKKVFLLNTHWAYFMKGKANEKNGKRDFAVRFHEEFMQAMEERKEEVGLIWRPHPLMFDAGNQRAKECMPYIEALIERMEQSDFAVVDKTDDYRYAFYASDAMVTTYSSLLNEYLITGKPVMIFQTKPTDEAGEASPIDHRSCYFRFPKDRGVPFSQFIDMVLKGEDAKYDERMEILRNKSFANMDGTAGEKIYNHLIKEMGVQL